MGKIVSNNELKNLQLEQWKYTNLNLLKNYNSNFIPQNKVLNKENDGADIIIYNGQVIGCGEKIKSKDIQIYNINEALEKNINNVNILFNKISIKNQNLFIENNTNNCNSGYYLFISDDLELIDTITIKNIIDQGDENSFLNYRNFIHCGKNVRATILNEEIYSVNQCINIVCETHVSENSKLEIINHNEKPNTKQIYNFYGCINKNSKLIHHVLDISGNILKNNYYIDLDKTGSEYLFNGLNISNNKEHYDNYIQINHNSPYTISNLNYKIVANQNSKSILFAKSIINENSFSSEAYQKNNNLILSDRARVHSNPQLEIYNDDVKCSHGSATGQIDDDAIYYMRTRGIDNQTAKKLILNSFVNEILNEISHLEIQDNLKHIIKNYL